MGTGARAGMGAGLRTRMRSRLGARSRMVATRVMRFRPEAAAAKTAAMETAASTAVEPTPAPGLDCLRDDGKARDEKSQK
jgi:hypothetical protein